MPFIKNLFTKIEKGIYGKIFLQPLYESLHRIGIRGMNFMQSQLVNQTGEIGAMTYALKKFKVNESKILFDIGANEGQFVQEMRKIFNASFKIYSFEPSMKAFNILKKKASEENIQFFNHGFGARKGKVSLYNTGELVGTTYPLSNSSQEVEQISLRTVDEFCTEYSISEIYYLKIDVEGAELDVLKGSANMINSGRIHFIQFEFGPNCMKAKVFLKDFFILLKDYHIYRIVKDGLRNIPKYDEILEIPLTSNYLAELNSK